MLVGYNTNISYKGTVYHVQTEDSGLKNPHIITLLYNKGTILSRKKTSYAEIAASPDYKETVQEMMKEQHKAMIKELIAGKHTPDVAASGPAPKPITEAPGEAAAPPPIPSVPPKPVQTTPAAPAEEKPAEPAQTSPAPPPQEKPAEPAQTSPAPPEKKKPAEPEPDKKQISKSLDDILLDYILKEEEK